MYIKKLVAYLFVFYFSLLFLLLLSTSESIQWKPIQDNTKYPPHLPNFSQYQDVKAKKTAFFEFLTPVIEEANTQIKQERILFLELKQKVKNSRTFSTWNRRQLALLKKKYKIKKSENFEEQLHILDLRINTVPKSLVLVQAANESAWGTSRFAQEANNLFGQWCFRKGCGLVPENRNQGASHEVQRFASVYDAVAAYLHNINTHRAYRELRKLRLELTKNEHAITGQHLAQGLQSYSERGSEYIKEIRHMIQTNNLE